MANMSYCRFENTLADLRDCIENFEDDQLSTSEFNAREEMIELCMEIAEEYADADFSGEENFEDEDSEE
ncbi:MAG: hypothetical protein LC687_04065 [Actinobacteria bacterium]|nr:hypothetical protein [Actinomycetota bacterium]MCA1807011.1 hypothetical protein [Actinomycetota bacterium]